MFYVGGWKGCFVEGMFSRRGYFIERGWCSKEEKEEEVVLYRWDTQQTMVLSDGEERVCSLHRWGFQRTPFHRNTPPPPP